MKKKSTKKDKKIASPGRHAHSGRPVEYDEKKIVELSRKYLSVCVDEEYVRIKSEGEKSTSYDNLIKVKIPTIEGLAAYLEIARSTVYEWKEKYKEFSDIIDEIMSKQAERLIENGLSGSYNATIAKLMLSKHGYVDKSEIEQETKITGKVATISAKDATEEEIDSFLIGQLK